MQDKSPKVRVKRQLQGNLPDPRIEPASHGRQIFTAEPAGKPTEQTGEAQKMILNE